MAIEAKVMLMNELERDLANTLTVVQMSTVMASLANKLTMYSLECNTNSASEPDDLLDAYLSAKTVEGKSEATIIQYRYVIGRLMASVNVHTKSITVYHLRKYLADEGARGISARTLENYRQTFNAYFNWLQRENLIINNPCRNLGKVKYPKKKKSIYNSADIERMKYNCKTLRDRAIICFLKATACRIGEMTSLNRDDVNLEKMECKVFGKGSKERIVYLDDVACMLLREYLDSRTDNYPALFIGKGTSRLSKHGVQNMLRKLGVTSKVKHLHAHKFRRSTATELIRHGMTVQEVAAILGHDKLDTTMEYVVLDQTDIKNSYRKYA